MQTSLNKGNLVRYVTNQLNTFFNDQQLIIDDEINAYINLALERTEYCFSRVIDKYYVIDSKIVFNHLHSDQYAMFLYFLANSAFKSGASETTCSKLYLLNKVLHAIDCYYEVSLPDFFAFAHPVGTVLGRAIYSDFLFVSQNCTVGGIDGVYPTIGRNFSMYKGSSVIGRCIIGENCKLTQNSVVFNMSLPDNSIFIGNTNNYKIKTSQNLIGQFLR